MFEHGFFLYYLQDQQRPQRSSSTNLSSRSITSARTGPKWRRAVTDCHLDPELCRVDWCSALEPSGPHGQDVRHIHRGFQPDQRRRVRSRRILLPSGPHESQWRQLASRDDWHGWNDRRHIRRHIQRGAHRSHPQREPPGPRFKHCAHRNRDPRTAHETTGCYPEDSEKLRKENPLRFYLKNGIKWFNPFFVLRDKVPTNFAFNNFSLA